MIDFNEIKDKDNRGKLALSLLRISVGVMFLIASWGKVMAEGGFGDRMVGFLNHQKDMPDWYRSIVDAVIIPNATLFGYLVAYGELFLGVALIVGVKARIASVFGLFMVANFMFAKGHAFWSPSNHDSLYVMLLLLFYFVDAGRFLGAENWADEKFPRLPF